MYDGGEIIIVKNIVFKDNLADHASLKGRPCIVISDFDNKLTLLPLSSKKPRGKRVQDTTIIYSDDFEDSTGFVPKQKEYVNLTNMFQRDLRYYDVLIYLKMKRYYELLLEIEEKRLENNPLCSEEYTSVYQDLEYKRNELKLKLGIK